MALATRVVGFTGTIASGKSTRCRHLFDCANRKAAQLQQKPASVMVKYVDADVVGHGIYEPGSPCYYDLIHNFGATILSAPTTSTNNTNNNNTSPPLPPINRRQLGQLVFNNPAQLQLLNRLCWPRILQALRTSLAQYSADAMHAESSVLLIFLEAALLTDSPEMISATHDVFLTHCDAHVAIQRVMRRDKLDRSEAERRVRSQANVEVKLRQLKAANYTGSIETFDTSVMELNAGLAQVERAFEAYWSKVIAPHLPT